MVIYFQSFGFYLFGCPFWSNDPALKMIINIIGSLSILGGLCALGGVFILTLPIPIVVNSFASYYKNRLWRNEVAYKKRQRAKKRKEMELLMRDNLLNILTVPGIQ